MCRLFCIDIALLLGADTRRDRGRRESVMRHFFAPSLPPAGLAAGMMEAAPKRLLVALACPAHTRAPRLAGARLGAIALAVIAPPTHPQLLLTERTVEQPVADDVDRTTSSPKRVDAAGKSRHCQWRDTRTCRSQRRLPRRLEEASPRAFTFCGARSCYRAGDRKKTRSAKIPTKKTKNTNQIHEADGSIGEQQPGERFRLRCALFTRFAHILSAAYSTIHTAASIARNHGDRAHDRAAGPASGPVELLKPPCPLCGSLRPWPIEDSEKGRYATRRTFQGQDRG